MTDQIILALPREVHEVVWKHLFSDRRNREEAAFIFVRPEVTSDGTTFTHVDWFAVPPHGFAIQSPAHIELTDNMRATVIKRAHDLEVSIVELHSHTGNWPAAFSPSDLEGLSEFVPHVRWRLKGRPYLAVVAARTGFDGFAWMTGGDEPRLLDGIRVGANLLLPTKLSRWKRHDDDLPLR